MYKVRYKGRASQVALVVKNLPANSGDVRDKDLIPGSGRPPGEWHGNPLQYSCLENPMDRGVCQVTVHGVTQSQTQLQRLSTHAHELQGYIVQHKEHKQYFIIIINGA